MSRSHNFKAVSVIIAGIEVTGYADDGGPSFEYETDVTSTTIGLDGEAVSSFMNNDSTLLTFSLQQQSPTNVALLGLWRAQEEATANGVERPPVAVSMIDTLNGDQILDANGVIERIPPPNKTREATANEWAVRLPRGRRALVLAATRVA